MVKEQSLVPLKRKQARLDDEALHPPRVAIIDDDVQLVKAITRILRANHKCTVNSYSSVEDFLVDVDRGLTDDVALILLDFHLLGQNGPKLVEELRKRRSLLLQNSYILGMTGDPERIVYNEFQDAGIEEIIQKPLQEFHYKKISKIAHAVNERNAGIAYQIDHGDKSVIMPNIIKRYI